MGLDLQQAEFEHLEQADRAGTDDDRVGFDPIGAFASARSCGCRRGAVRLGRGAARFACHGQRISSDSLPRRSFQSSASVSGLLRFVMLGQRGASSALSLIMCC